MTTDPFGTAGLRAAVARAWLESPARFREDANTEEDFGPGHYAGRLVTELAQNAADAAARAGVPGRLHLELVEPPSERPDGTPAVLVARNTGAPLDRAGVVALAGMRASAKRDAESQVGRFGVGFSAVRAVSDDVTVASRSTGGVRFSLEATRELLAGLGNERGADVAEETGGREAVEPLTAEHPAERRTELGAEVRRRGTSLPMLRLPFEASLIGDVTADAPGLDAHDRYETEVHVVLRDDQATAAVRGELAALDDLVLVALPALDEITVVHAGDVRVLRDVEDRWVVVRDHGTFPPGDGARVEDAATWDVAWALPREGGAPTGPGASDAVLHAPTPTAEAMAFPAVLLASFPLDPSRRHVVDGEAARTVARHAGAAYARLAEEVAARPATTGLHVLDLVPTGLPGSAVDALVRDAAIEALAAAPVLEAGSGTDADPDPDLAPGPGRVAPRDATFVAGDPGQDPAVLAALAPGTPGLVAVTPEQAARARACGVQRADLADAVARVPDGLSPERWRDLYAAFEPWIADASVREALGTVAVPLADGRVARGARGLVLPTGAAADPDVSGAFAALDVRTVHPSATHPVLERLGARSSDAFDVLVGVRDAVVAASADVLDGAADDVEADRLRDAVLGLVAAALADRPGLDPDRFPFWLGELPLPVRHLSEDGASDADPAPARESLLPGSQAATLLDLPAVADALVGRWGEAVLRAVGVRSAVGVYVVPDVLTPDETADAGPHAEAMADLTAPSPDDPAPWLDGWRVYLEDVADAVGHSAHVGDLAAVADLDSAADPARMLRAVAQDRAARAALLTPVRGAAGRTHPSYAAWWFAGLGAAFALPGSDVPLLRACPYDGLDEAVLRAVGGVSTLAGLDALGWAEALDGLPDVGESVDPAVAVAVWRGLAEAADALDDAGRAAFADDVDRLPVQDGGRCVVVDVADVVVADVACWAQLRAVVPAPAGRADELADLLDVPVAEDLPPDAPDPTAPAEAAPPTEHDVPAAVRELFPAVPVVWTEHEDLRVDGVEVDWWVSGPDRARAAHAATSDGLARALAAASGRFEDRHAILAVLLSPEDSTAVRLDSAWDGYTPR
ncbi:hypothetical protein GCM10025865_19640 [Paraoerskovia sediminicola]|uniref:ATP-binding protein n=1 Tax=Paraoerskovia sediminicola TaxID=1138587 RepID=A0ABM8G3F5_9CELL|nr:ATP-binding protein [Paraoerskovia sediminicola]BDZ42665.1 hypothetical protein GCM10025865_19640 [Paraoerskovia sediminicola]